MDTPTTETEIANIVIQRFSKDGDTTCQCDHCHNYARFVISSEAPELHFVCANCINYAVLDAFAEVESRTRPNVVADSITAR